MITLGCPDCQIPFRDGVMNCYKCGQHRSYFVEMESLPPTSDKDLRSSKGADQQVLNSTRAMKLPATLDDLLQAQNRTTHAVRALAITFVAAPIITLAVVLGIGIAAHSGNPALMILTGIAGVVVSVGTLIVAIDELRESKVS